MSNERAKRTAAIFKARRSLGLAKSRRRLPRQIYPRTIEREYASVLRELVHRVRSILQPLLDELPHLLEYAAHERQDAGEGSRARRLINEAKERMKDAVSSSAVEEIASRFGRRTSSYQKVQIGRQIQAALGADVFSADKSIAGLLDGFVSENASLIENLPARVIQGIEQIVTRGIQSGTRHEDLAREIEREFEIGENRAKLIARDQVGKLYGQINAERQKELGVTEFIWRTVNDQRVRPEHIEREGKKFKYSDPPEDGLPGMPINCRCNAEPDFSAILGLAED